MRGIIKTKIVKIFIIAAALFFVSFQLISKTTEIDSDIKNYFSGEDEYFEYLRDNVKFSSVELKFVEVIQGDNFWKIARDYETSIDSLIGVNIYWEDLMARIGQRVVVPSERGVLEFAADFGEIKTLAEQYGVHRDDMEIQELPFLYSFYYKFSKNRKPVAVFIRDVKPKTENMTASLAGRFELREMFRSPLGGRLSSFFGNRTHPVYSTRKFHNGLDIAAKHGTLVGAARAGKVVSTGWNGGYGKTVVIEHDKGYKTLYGHLSQINVRPGQVVEAGRIVGRVGSTGLSTGPHLHFTLWHNGKLINPMDVLW